MALMTYNAALPGMKARADRWHDVYLDALSDDLTRPETIAMVRNEWVRACRLLHRVEVIAAVERKRKNKRGNR